MNLYFSNSYPDEDGTAEPAKSGIIFAKRAEIIELCKFFEQVKEYIDKHDNCHMHLCDSFKNWRKGEHFDLEINLESDAENL